MRAPRTGEAPAVRIEVENEWAWCGEQRLSLTPRAFAVLRHLVDHAGRLITKDELLTTVWRDAIVSDAALSSCIRDLRSALGDSSHTPRYIETVHRRGFRFIGPITPPAAARADQDLKLLLSSALPPIPEASSATLVGRDAELARLHELRARTVNGQRQLVFVTGEPGIGKTALVEAFLSQIGIAQAGRIGRGQCVEQYGAGEAYLPILEALGRLGREAGGEGVAQILKQYAPTWLLQLPALLTDRELEAVERRAQGATRERMLRELVEALDALSQDEPLVLVLEDLHWSDSSTIDLLARLARRREPARLLVLGTYRPADVAGTAHPLRPVKQELQLHGHCEEIPLEFLSVAAIGEYLSRRFPEHRFPSDLVAVLHRTTDGNPLFAVSTIDYLIAQGQMREVDGRWGLSVPLQDIALGTPETLAQIVEKQVERLTADEQMVLAVASVAGAEFSSAVAAAGGIDPRAGERICEGLALRGQFLRARGLAEWPDGTVAGRYAFIHALYRNVLYARVSLGHRVGLHLRTGELLERSHGERAAEIAGELAMHFEHGRDFERAVQYRRQAAEHALRQHGYREIAEHVTRALDLLKALPDSQHRTQEELTLQVMLGSALTALKGHAAREVEHAYARARELCEQVDDTPRLFPVLMALGWFYFVRGPVATAHEAGNRLQAMGEATRDPAIVLAAHTTSGRVSFYEGDFEAALDHLQRGIALYDPTAHTPTRSPAFRAVTDPGASCITHAALTLWMLGYPARAVARMQEGSALAHSIAHPFTVAHVARFGAVLHLCRRDHDAAREQADASVAVSTEHGFSAVLGAASFHQGWVLAEQGREEEGLAMMREWIAVCREIRAEALLPAYLAWLAEVYGKIGRPGEGLALIREGLAAGEQSGYQYWKSELHRLQGTLTLQSAIVADPVAPRPERRRDHVDRVKGRPSASAAEKEAESSFLEALAIARRQRAKSFELRAATSLGRLWASQGKRRGASALVAEVHQGFTEGFDTPDLRDADALLAELDKR